MRLNLFCNKHGIDGWVNVDIEKHPEFEGGEFRWCNLDWNAWDLKTKETGDHAFRAPEGSSVDHIRAYDGPEHLPDPIKFMNQCWYYLKPGGILEIWVPSTDGRGAFQDPTHKSFWNVNSFHYYDPKSDIYEIYPQITACFDFRCYEFNSSPKHKVRHILAVGKCLKDGSEMWEDEEFKDVMREVSKRNAALQVNPQFKE